MTTTLQQIQDRAIGYSSANGLTSLTQTSSEIINQIVNFEADLFDLAAKTNRYFFALKVAISSTGGASERLVDLAGLATSCYRLLQFKLNDGREANQVELTDPDGELTPRYFILGKKLYEIGSDWSPAAGAVAGFLYYMKGPAVIDVNGALTQTLTIDDDFTEGIELRLARYLAHKDVGRDPAEIERLDGWIQDFDETFVEHLTKFGGVEARRFNTATTGDKK